MSGDELADWRLTMKAWLQAKDKHFNGLATSALVFNSQNRVLLLQRAPHDSMPNKWEPPGGAVDHEDESILHGCARELWEEGGLIAKRIVRIVPADGTGRVFTNRSGTSIFYGFTFEVEIDGDGSNARTDPNEHSQLLWATEEQVKEGKMEDGTPMPITAPQVTALILEAFKLRREDGK